MREWIKTGAHPLARALRGLGRGVFRGSAPYIPGLHDFLYRACRLSQLVWGEFWRIAFWTPVFRSRTNGGGAWLHLAGPGMPLVTGPVEIRMGGHCRLSTALTISGRASTSPPPVLKIGDNVGVGWQTTIAVGRRVVFEDNVRIAGRAFFAGYPGHPLDAAARARGEPCTDEQTGDIVLEKDAWLGFGCTVAAGVTIGAGAVVAAGSVVTRDIPPGVLAGGAPARVIRALDPRGGEALEPPSRSLAAV